MGKISQDSASHVEEVEGFEGRYGQIDDYTVGFETITGELDTAPLFVGLPDDACQCPHWGYVIAGRLVFTYRDGTVDEIGEGEAYYAKPGHVPSIDPGTRLVEFSPTVELEKTLAVVTANASAQV